MQRLHEFKDWLRNPLWLWVNAMIAVFVISYFVHHGELPGLLTVVRGLLLGVLAGTSH